MSFESKICDFLLISDQCTSTTRKKYHTYAAVQIVIIFHLQILSLETAC